MELELKKSEERFRSLGDSAPMGLFYTDNKGNVKYTNRKWQEITGMSLEESLGIGWVSAIHPDDLQSTIDDWEISLNEGKNYSGEFRFITTDGEVKWVYTTTAPMKLESGEIIGHVGANEDITDRKKAEESILLQSEITDNMNEGVYLIGLEDVIIKYTNPKFEKMFGYGPGEMIGKHASIVNAPSVKDPIERADEIMATIREHGSWSGEVKNIKNDGTFFWCYAKVSIFNHSVYGNVVVAVHEDITDRKTAEEKTEESEKRFRQIIARSDAGYFFIDKDGIFRDVNEAWAKMYKYDSTDEIIGKHFSVVQRIDDLEAVDEFVGGIMKGDPAYMTGEFSRKCNDDSDGYHTFSSWPVVQSGEPLGIEGFIIDTTDRRLAEDELRESEERYRQLLSATFEGIVITKKGGFITWNKRFESLFGYNSSDILNMKVIDIVFPGDRDLVKNNILSDYDKPYEHRMIRKDGSVSYVEVHGQKISYQGEPARLTAIHDITERKKIEDNLKLSLDEKEILLKEVHHRSKNNMQLISSLIGLQSEKIKDNQALDLFRDLENRIQTMALIHQKLYQSQDISKVDFNEYIKALMSEIEESQGANSSGIEISINIKGISLNIQKSIPCALLINELITNIYKYAFPEGKKGKINIDFVQEKKGYYKLTISDNGVGLPKGLNIEKTDTLGLQLVDSLTKQLNGTIQIGKGKGASFIIKFPCD